MEYKIDATQQNKWVWNESLRNKKEATSFLNDYKKTERRKKKSTNMIFFPNQSGENTFLLIFYSNKYKYILGNFHRWLEMTV